MIENTKNSLLGKYFEMSPNELEHMGDTILLVAEVIKDNPIASEKLQEHCLCYSIVKLQTPVIVELFWFYKPCITITFL